MKISTRIHLELTPQQAYWLKTLTQDYVRQPGCSEDEPLSELAIRAGVFDALPGFDGLTQLILQQRDKS